jgi:hypothetical protein
MEVVDWEDCEKEDCEKEVCVGYWMECFVV